MAEGGLERSCGKPSLELVEAGGIGLHAVFLLLMSRLPQAPGSVLPPLRAPPGPQRATLSDGAARGQPPDPGSSSLANLARSLQKAEAVLRSCVSPGLRRLLLPRPGEAAGDDDDDDDDSPEALARLAQVEQSFLGLRRCFCVWENPRTETFQGHVRPLPGDAAHAAFSYHPVRPRVAERCATLHALLQHRHHLRLSREYCRRLKGASDFIRWLLLLLAEQPGPQAPAGEPGAARALRGLCEELRTHAGHWSGLQRRMRGDPWLRPLLLRRPESVLHMKQALWLLALHAVRLVESYAEAALRGLARASPASAPPALLADLFQGLEIYNRVVGDLALELGPSRLPGGPAAWRGTAGAAGAGSQAFPAERVLAILAAERGRLAAERLHRLLQRQDGDREPERVRWEDAAVPWPAERRSVEADVGSPGRPGREELTRLSEELQALCREDKELMHLVLGALVASTDSPWRRLLDRPRQEKGPAAEGPEGALRPGSAGRKPVRWLDASHAEAAQALYARYSALFWEAAGAALARRLEVPRARGPGWAAALAQDLGQALGQACPPRECQEELRRLGLRLLCGGVFRSWDGAFARALGSGLSDKCSAEPARAGGAARSRTARLLQRLYPALAFALRRLQPPPARRAGGPPGSPDLRLQLLGRCLATAQAAGSWLMSKAYQYLASWSLRQFLLVTQGDLQLLKAETDELTELVNAAFPEGLPSSPLSPQEQQLCQQIRSTAAGMQLFSQDVLRMFSTDCKRVSAEIFDQTMPLGKHWRLGLRADLPSCPSEYAAAAAQTVLGQVLQGIQLLPRDSQVPTLTQVMTAFVEAWMDHILAQKIKFSLQGALQLKQDFELVRELVQSEHYSLAPEIRQSLLSLRVFQQMDSAILCLLQQPSGKAFLPSHTWRSLRRCCSNDGVRTQEPGAGDLDSLESLEAAGAAAAGAAPSARRPPERLQRGAPESYLTGSQQQWLSLRLHGPRRWRVPGLPCGARSPEP